MTVTLIYDADCGFCTRSATWIQGDNAFDLTPWQSIDDLAAAGLTQQMVEDAAHWSVDGKVVASGADAIGNAMIARGGIFKIAGRITISRPVRPLAAIVYRLIAKNRHSMPGGTSACRLDR